MNNQDDIANLRWYIENGSPDNIDSWREVIRRAADAFEALDLAYTNRWANDVSEDFEAALTCMVRRFAEEVTGGHCMFADDDLRVLAGLAMRAAKAGMIDGMHPTVQANIRKLHHGGEGMADRTAGPTWWWTRTAYDHEAIDEEGCGATFAAMKIAGGRGFESAEEAIASWNRRPGADPSPEALRRYMAPVTAIMPADFKDWHENSPLEWPDVLAALLSRSEGSEGAGS